MQKPAAVLLWFTEANPSEEVRAVIAKNRCERRPADRLTPAAAIVLALDDGPVVAVVENSDEGREMLALGADDFVRRSDLGEFALEEAIEGAIARARGRLLRDQYLVDRVRRDDVSTIEQFASALGHRLLGPLAEWDPLESTCRHASLSIL